MEEKRVRITSSSNLESIDILDVIGRPVKTINIQKSLVNVNIENNIWPREFKSEFDKKKDEFLRQ